MRLPPPAPPLDRGYRVEPFAEQSAITPEAVIAMWTSEGAVDPETAARRIHELLVVAGDEDGGVAGVSTTYLERNAQLGLDLWYVRVFVPRAHRMSNVALNLAVTSRDLLSQRFTSGADTRGVGMGFEIENDGLKSYFPDAVWFPIDMVFIGENARGDWVRVHYFPGALGPPPG